MSDGREKRRYKRMRKPLTIEFREAGGEKDKWSLGAVLNIGAGGVLFYHNEEIRLGAELELRFSLNETDIVCRGKVIREEQIPHMSFSAIVFTDIDEKYKEAISSAAEKFHPEPLND
ncbi:MAG: hypothetical protein GF408_07360 [Candidatus Omnitrophica bacterium]|nr:hypothetical protein [Candidatus Omnitrophota bacterium]